MSTSTWKAQHRGSRTWARLAVVGATVGLGLAGTSGTALAAGNGYGGKPVLPPGGVPGGFRQVEAVESVGSGGGVLTGSWNRVHNTIELPPGSQPGREQVVVTSPDLHTITPSTYRDVPPRLKGHRPLYAVGVLLQSGSRPVVDHRFVTLRLAGSEFTRADFVLVFSPARHGFVPAPKGHARCVNGHVVVRFRAGTELLVLGG